MTQNIRFKSAKRFRILLLWLLLAVSFSCVRDPESPGKEKPPDTSAEVLVLNEGLFGRDNASISRYNRASGEVQQHAFQAANPGLKLGDTANSMAIHGDRGYIVMNGSNTIEIVALPSLASAGRIRLPGNPSPRQAVIANDTLGFVTALFTDQVIVFNPATQTVTGAIAVGPAPEGLARAGDRLVVANSGLGDIRAHEPGAGTVSLIDLATQEEVARLPLLRNPTAVQPGPDGLVYVAGTGSYSETALSGIAIVDAAAAAVLDTIAIANHPTDFVLASDGSGYALTDSAVVKFSWRQRRVLEAHFIEKSTIGAGAWLSAIALDENVSELLIANARNFTTNGEVVGFDLAGKEKYRFPVKLNPGMIVILP